MLGPINLLIDSEVSPPGTTFGPTKFEKCKSGPIFSGVITFGSFKPAITNP